MKTQSSLALGLFLILAAAPAAAMGPVDGEVGAVWWANEFDASDGASTLNADGDAPGFRAELWMFKKYGVRAGIYTSDLGDVNMEDSDYMSLDLLWRPISPMENTFVAFGLGYQEMDLASIGLAGDTSGARVSAEGRFGLGVVYLYGQASYLPELDDAPAVQAADGRFFDMSGMEYELGVSWKMAPFVNLRAGFREHSVDFTREDALSNRFDGTAESSGFLLGLTFNF